MSLIVNKCGCDCKSGSEFEAQDNLSPCFCPYCADGAPMQFAILSGWNCSYTCNGLTLHPITPLFADGCMFDGNCTWTARICKDCDYANLGLAVGCDATGLQCGFPCNAGNLVAGSADESVSDDCEIAHHELAVKSAGEYAQWYPPVIIQRSGGSSSLAWHDLQFKCCYSNKLLFDSTDAGDVDIVAASGAWLDFYYEGLGAGNQDGLSYDQSLLRIAFVENCTQVVWQLVITSSSTATLTGYYPDTYDSTGETVVYESTDFDCSSRSSFRMVSNDNPTCAFPESLCIERYSSCWKTPCDSPQSACNCCDPGNRNAYFTFAPFETCLTEEKTILIERNATLPSGVTDPEGACGYFWGSTGYCDGVTTGVLTWCDGTDWNASLYCSTDGGTTFTELCTTVGTMTECCPGNAVTYDCAIEDFGDCCCETTVNICGCDIPTTLYGTISLTGCDIDGQVVTLTFDGTNRWLGTIVSASCGTLTVRAEITSCNWSVAISSGPSTFCMNSTPTSPGTECPVTSLVASNTWDNTACSCCSGTITVTVTP